MTNTEAIAILNNEIACLQRDCERIECADCDLILPSAEPIIEAFNMAITALENPALTLLRAELDATGVVDMELVDDLMDKVQVKTRE